MFSLVTLCFVASTTLSSFSVAESNLICQGKYSKSLQKDYENSNVYCRGFKSFRVEIIWLTLKDVGVLRIDHRDFCYGF